MSAAGGDVSLRRSKKGEEEAVGVGRSPKKSQVRWLRRRLGAGPGGPERNHKSGEKGEGGGAHAVKAPEGVG